MYSIRDAEIEDLPAIAHLSGLLGYASDESVITQRFKAVISESRHAVFVAESPSHEIAGWIHILPRILLLSRPLAEIGGLIVSEMHRRRGAGESLVRHAEEWAVKHDYQGLVVRSDSKRIEAHHFYPKMGYEYRKDQKVYFRFFNVIQI